MTFTRKEVEAWIAMLFGEWEYSKEYFNQCVGFMERWFESKGLERKE